MRTIPSRAGTPSVCVLIPSKAGLNADPNDRKLVIEQMVLIPSKAGLNADTITLHPGDCAIGS